jgi:hypothetical protein
MGPYPPRIVAEELLARKSVMWLQIGLRVLGTVVRMLGPGEAETVAAYPGSACAASRRRHGPFKRLVDGPGRAGGASGDCMLTPYSRRYQLGRPWFKPRES